MRRFWTVLFAVCLVLCLAACGNEVTSGNPSQAGTSTPVPDVSSTIPEPPHAHSYTAHITSRANCTDDGLKTFSCSCGSSYTKNIPSPGHSWGEWTVTRKPTTAAEGNSQRICNTCSTTEDKSIPKLPVVEKGAVSQAQLQKIQSIFLKLVNEERVRAGVSPLSSNTYLAGRAQIRSREIMKNFSHTRPDGQQWKTVVDTSLYSYRALGENICMTPYAGTGVSDEWVGSSAQIESTASRIFTLFKNSPGHYANMIKGDYTECGIGLSYEVQGGVPSFYLAHLFGKR